MRRRDWPHWDRQGRLPGSRCRNNLVFRLFPWDCRQYRLNRHRISRDQALRQRQAWDCTSTGGVSPVGIAWGRIARPLADLSGPRCRRTRGEGREEGTGAEKAQKDNPPVAVILTPPQHSVTLSGSLGPPRSPHPSDWTVFFPTGWRMIETSRFWVVMI